MAFLKLWHAMKTFPSNLLQKPSKQDVEGGKTRDTDITELLRLALEVRRCTKPCKEPSTGDAGFPMGDSHSRSVGTSSVIQILWVVSRISLN